ncbi:B-cell CLL/lymphoma 6 member B protein [Terrapene carolina triunguis]|uniref:B-cell CLL/lymphoma 6 member B protein n=1 Tax=Terrapene triunguis TaxID=2587831 RepID=UPI000E7792F1|nr:B-cell CLL/lymphoma 6 member B protein [Terrapene carolina triunguis]
MSSGGSGAPGGSVREFTRHASDVLLNLDQLRHRRTLTDVTLLVGGRPLVAHKAVLAACSGFFYSIFLAQGGSEVSVVTLPGSIQPGGFQALLDFMYTSRLPLTPASVPALLSAATYLQMEHVVDACHRFVQASYDRASFYSKPLPSPADPKPQDPLQGPPDASRMVPAGGPHPERPSPGAPLRSAPARPPAKDSGGAPPGGERGPPDSPSRSEGHPASPRESSGCAPDPKACNWKKYKFIVLNSLRGEGGGVGGGAVPQPPGPLTPPEPPAGGDRGASRGGEDGGGPRTQHDSAPCRPSPAPLPCPLCTQRLPQGPPQPAAGAGPYDCGACELGLDEEEGEEGGAAGGQAPAAAPHDNKPFKCQLCCSSFRYKGNLASHRAVHTGEKPYRCGVCGAQFNRPANLKTHSRIHSGEKPYKCETCGSSFVQVAHLRAHVLIHTGEKPYPCETCGTRFRHLQTLKSHIRIHTGEKPYHCETCHLHFRHKSQLRLHLRQKHGAVTNTKIRYAVLAGPSGARC